MNNQQLYGSARGNNRELNGNPSQPQQFSNGLDELFLGGHPLDITPQDQTNSQNQGLLMGSQQGQGFLDELVLENPVLNLNEDLFANNRNRTPVHSNDNTNNLLRMNIPHQQQQPPTPTGNISRASIQHARLVHEIPTTLSQQPPPAQQQQHVALNSPLPSPRPVLQSPRGAVSSPRGHRQQMQPQVQAANPVNKKIEAAVSFHVQKKFINGDGINCFESVVRIQSKSMANGWQLHIVFTPLQTVFDHSAEVSFFRTDSRGYYIFDSKPDNARLSPGSEITVILKGAYRCPENEIGPMLVQICHHPPGAVTVFEHTAPRRPISWAAPQLRSNNIEPMSPRKPQTMNNDNANSTNNFQVPQPPMGAYGHTPNFNMNQQSQYMPQNSHSNCNSAPPSDSNNNTSQPNPNFQVQTQFNEEPKSSPGFRSRAANVTPLQLPNNNTQQASSFESSQIDWRAVQILPNSYEKFQSYSPRSPKAGPKKSPRPTTPRSKLAREKSGGKNGGQEDKPPPSPVPKRKASKDLQSAPILSEAAIAKSKEYAKSQQSVYIEGKESFALKSPRMVRGSSSPRPNANKTPSPPLVSPRTQTAGLLSRMTIGRGKSPLSLPAKEENGEEDLKPNIGKEEGEGETKKIEGSNEKKESEKKDIADKNDDKQLDLLDSLLENDKSVKVEGEGEDISKETDVNGRDILDDLLNDHDPLEHEVDKQKLEEILGDLSKDFAE
eukprot:Nk52_evm65s2657 gene=Nk52_evmTU65s2657